MRAMASLLCALLWGSRALAGEPAPPAFTKKPVATREGDKAKIEFAVDRETDVAVYIENAPGEIVRHLVAGVLGKNPPEPLRANALAQAVEWDGKDDDGKPAAGGPFRVRVGLGLKASWGGTAFAEKGKEGPNRLYSVQGLAAGPDGHVYVMCDPDSTWGQLYVSAIRVFWRDGSYEKTIKPFPSWLPLERLKAVSAFRNDRGYLNPLLHAKLLGLYPVYGDYPFTYPYSHPAVQMAVTPAGHLAFPVVGKQLAPLLAVIDSDGGLPDATYTGPALLAGDVAWSSPCMATSADGRNLYITGLGGPKKNENGLWRVPNHPAVYRVSLAERGPAEVFFGDAAKAGSDEKHLDDPRGLAVDGQGHLLVGDNRNNRVVVLMEANGAFVGSFAVPSPGWLAIHPKTGAVYVHSGESIIKKAEADKAGSIVKFMPSTGSAADRWKEAKEVSRIKLPTVDTVHASLPAALSFALETSGQAASLWHGRSNVAVEGKGAGALPLLRCEDRGDRFSDFEPAKCVTFKLPGSARPAADPLRRQIMVGDQILDEATGNVRRVHVEFRGSHGCVFRLGPDGCIYAQGAGAAIQRFGPDGKAKPFAATGNNALPVNGRDRPGDTGSTMGERDFYVDRKNDIYVKRNGTQYHGVMSVDAYDQDGNFKRTAIWGVSDGAYGPRVDPAGNLYIMEVVTPVGQPFPAEFVPHVKDKPLQPGYMGLRTMASFYDWYYGSVVKFSPAGGNIWLKGNTYRPGAGPAQAWNDKQGNRPLGEPVKLPDSFVPVQVGATNRGDDNRMQGALWVAPGVAHVTEADAFHGCHCTICDFDVDDFGRSFAPDNGRQRVTAFDTNGNTILHIGAYGNQDYRGPESYVLDPKEKRYRPRRPEDPKDLKSPFADPEIGFIFILGVAVTDKHAYVTDGTNRRVLRVKLDYAATETVNLP